MDIVNFSGWHRNAGFNYAATYLNNNNFGSTTVTICIEINITRKTDSNIKIARPYRQTADVPANLNATNACVIPIDKNFTRF